MEKDSRQNEAGKDKPAPEGDPSKEEKRNGLSKFGLKNAAAQLEALKRKLKGTSEEKKFGEDTRQRGADGGMDK